MVQETQSSEEAEETSGAVRKDRLKGAFRQFPEHPHFSVDDPTNDGEPSISKEFINGYPDLYVSRLATSGPSSLAMSGLSILKDVQRCLLPGSRDHLIVVQHVETDRHFSGLCMKLSYGNSGSEEYVNCSQAYFRFSHLIPPDI